MHPAPWQRVLLAELAQRSDIELHVVVLRKQFGVSETFSRGPVTFHCVKTLGGFRAPTLFWYDTILIRRIFRRLQPDLVHAWGTENGAALVASRLADPSLVTVQGLMTLLVELFPAGWYRRATARLERLALNRLKFATAESNFSAGYVRSHYPRLKVRQIELAPDPAYGHVARRPEADRLLFVGTLGFAKGGDLLVRALAQMPASVRCTVVGRVAPGFREALQETVADEIWRRLDFRVDLGPQEMAQELATATLACCPTRLDTGPASVKEAVIAGLPVVASRVGGIPDYIEEGKNGLLFNDGDLAGLVGRLREAFAHADFGRGAVDPDTRRSKQEYLDARRMADSFVRFYQEIAPGRASVGHAGQRERDENASRE